MTTPTPAAPTTLWRVKIDDDCAAKNIWRWSDATRVSPATEYRALPAAQFDALVARADKAEAALAYLAGEFATAERLGIIGGDDEKAKGARFAYGKCRDMVREQVAALGAP